MDPSPKLSILIALREEKVWIKVIIHRKCTGRHSVVGVHRTQNYFMTSEELDYTSLDHTNRLDQFLNRFYGHDNYLFVSNMTLKWFIVILSTPIMLFSDITYHVVSNVAVCQRKSQKYQSADKRSYCPFFELPWNDSSTFPTQNHMGF